MAGICPTCKGPWGGLLKWNVKPDSSGRADVCKTCHRPRSQTPMAAVSAVKGAAVQGSNAGSEDNLADGLLGGGEVGGVQGWMLLGIGVAILVAIIVVGVVLTAVLMRQMRKNRVEPLVVYKDEVVAWDDNLEAPDSSADEFTDEDV